MLKPALKSLLLHPTVSYRLKNLYRDEVREEVTLEYWNLLLRDNVWLYSLMKSGATYMLNSIAAYRSLRNGDAGPSFAFDQIHHFGVVRGRYPVAVQRLREYACAGIRARTVILHTHEYLEADSDRVVLMNRNPYDYLVSSFHFHYHNRRGKGSTSFDTALPSMMQHYVSCYRAQDQLIEDSRRPTLQIWYEDFMEEPAASLTRVLDFVGEEADLEEARRAIDMCSVSNLRDHERSAGKAVIASENYTRSHFVRSGRVGEYREALTPEQIARVSAELRRAGLDHLVVGGD